MGRVLATAFFAAIIGSATAQESTPREVRDLGWMVGAWIGKGQIAFGGRETEIVSETAVSYDGQFLKIVSADRSAGFTLTKTAMIGWDAAKERYVSYTFTNIAPKPRVAYGKLENGKLVMVSEPWEAEGATAVARETMTKRDDGKFGLTMEFKSGEKWESGMDFLFTKR